MKSNQCISPEKRKDCQSITVAKDFETVVHNVHVPDKTWVFVVPSFAPNNITNYICNRHLCCVSWVECRHRKLLQFVNEKRQFFDNLLLDDGFPHPHVFHYGVRKSSLFLPEISLSGNHTCNERPQLLSILTHHQGIEVEFTKESMLIRVKFVEVNNFLI